MKPASFRKLRGPTYIAIIADELAFWFTDASYANPDVEVLAAARPGLLTTRGPLIMASSPTPRWACCGTPSNEHYGPDGSPSVLVAKGSTRDFNQTIPQAEIDRELERDRARNTAELLAEFRGDLEGYVALEVVEACIGNYFEMAPAPGARATTPSPIRAGGSDDSFHAEHLPSRWRACRHRLHSRGQAAVLARAGHHRLRGRAEELSLPSRDR